MTATEQKPPRIPPLPRDAWTDEARDVFAYWEGPDARENGSRSNTMMTLAQHPRLALPQLDFGKYLLTQSTLTPRQKELILLRVAWRYNSKHQWTHHVIAARKIGMTDAEFDALRQTGAQAIWPAEEQAFLDAIDQLHAKGRVEDATWAALAERMSVHQLMDFVYSVGFFTMNAWAFESMDIQLEEDVEQYSKPADELVQWSR